MKVQLPILEDLAWRLEQLFPHYESYRWSKELRLFFRKAHQINLYLYYQQRSRFFLTVLKSKFTSIDTRNTIVEMVDADTVAVMDDPPQIWWFRNPELEDRIADIRHIQLKREIFVLRTIKIPDVRKKYQILFSVVCAFDEKLNKVIQRHASSEITVTEQNWYPE